MVATVADFAPGFLTWRRALAAVPTEKKLEIFDNACAEIVGFCSRGLAPIDAADALYDLAVGAGILVFESDDAVQAIIARHFEDIERVPDEVEPELEQPRNGHDKAPAALGRWSLFPVNEKHIPWRQWLIPGLFLRKHVTVIVAPSGSGKSLLTLQLGMSIALNQEWAGWRPRGEFRSMFINSEDDADEIRRRVAAAAHVMQIDQMKLVGRILVADAEHYIIAEFDNKTKTMKATPKLEAIITAIKDERIDLIFVDPFAETFTGDENSNSELKWAGMLWRQVARRTGAAVCLVHHTKKYASGMAGDVDAARGAGALIGIARIVSTVFPMTRAEAEAMSIAENERSQFLRYDDAKANLNLVSPVAKWFRKDTIRLDNGTDDIPGDDVGALVPWKPQGTWDGVTQEQIDALLAAIDRGIQHKGMIADYYTLQRSGKVSRWVGKIVMSTLKCSIVRASEMVKAWTISELLVAFEYRSPATRKFIAGCGSKDLARRMAEALIEDQARQKVLKFPTVRIIGDCDENTICLHCQKTGNVKRIRDARHVGSKSETLHEGCAEAWWKRNE